MCLGVDFWTFIMFVICGLRFSSNWIGFGQYFFNVFFPLTLPFLGFKLHIYYAWYCPLYWFNSMWGFFCCCCLSFLFRSFFGIYFTCLYTNSFFCGWHSPVKYFSFRFQLFYIFQVQNFHCFFFVVSISIFIHSFSTFSCNSLSILIIATVKLSAISNIQVISVLDKFLLNKFCLNICSILFVHIIYILSL